jgi:hypothetical protein
VNEHEETSGNYCDADEVGANARDASSDIALCCVADDTSGMPRFMFVPAVMLAACAASPPDADATDTCGAAALDELVGQDLSALSAMTFPDTTRFIRPGDAVTMDYVAERLNFDLSDDGKIQRAWCG